MIPGSELAQGNLNPTPSLALAAAFLSLSFGLCSSLCLSDISLPSQFAASLCPCLAHRVPQLHFCACKAPLSTTKALSSSPARSSHLSSLQAACLQKPPSSECILRAWLDERHSRREVRSPVSAKHRTCTREEEMICL